MTQVLYQRGRFSAQDTVIVSQVQLWYLLRLPIPITATLLVRALNAMRANQVLATIAILQAVLNAVLDWVLMQRLGAPGIAAASLGVSRRRLQLRLGLRVVAAEQALQGGCQPWMTRPSGFSSQGTSVRRGPCSVPSLPGRGGAGLRGRDSPHPGVRPTPWGTWSARSCEPLEPIAKSGPNLSAPPASAATLTRAGFRAMGLANNHILDYGPSGLAADGAGLPGRRPAGLRRRPGPRRGAAAAHLRSPGAPHRVPGRGRGRALALAGPATAGANPLDPITRRADDRGLPLPVRPARGAAARRQRGLPVPEPMAAGPTAASWWSRAPMRCSASIPTASAAWSSTVGGTILYGQGNFLFNYAAHGALGGQGLGVVVVFPKEGPARLEWHPVEQSPSGPRDPAVLAGDPRQRVLEGLEGAVRHPGRSRPVRPGLVRMVRPPAAGLPHQAVRDGAVAGPPEPRQLDVPQALPETLLGIYNVISCESHRATFLGGLDQAIRRLSGRRRP